jgi:hypothetical protein
MIDNSTKKLILDEILQSESFANSKLNCKLLSYLVECSIEEKSPSEYSIAIDVFNKDSGFNPNEDTNVRVSVYNLRKKLERYYQNMGKRKKLRVKIPKGHYEVEFFNYSKENILDKFKTPVYWLLVLVFGLILTILYLYSQIPSHKELQKIPNQDNFINKLFSDLTTSKKSKLITLGDDFIYYSDFSEFKTTSERKMIRNSNINSEEQFEKYKSLDSSRENFKKLPFSFFNQAAVWATPLVTKIFNNLDLEYTLKGSSSLTTNELKSHDIFFLGSFWTLGILEPIISKLNISYNIIGDETLTIVNPSNRDSTLIFQRTGVPAFDHVDYSLFIKVPGPNNNTIFLSTSFYATGTVGAIKFLTTKKSMQELEAKFTKSFSKVPDSYMIILKSTGYNREVLSTELIEIYEIDPQSIEW